MIVFDRLWQTMKQKKISQYKLIKDYHISTGQIDRLRKNCFVSTFTINELCRILDCNVEDVIQYKKDQEVSPLANQTTTDK